MKVTAITLAAITGLAAGQVNTVYQNRFDGQEGQTGESYLAELGLEFAGNGTEGGGFWEFGRAAIVVQSFGSRQSEAGFASFVLNDTTLEAGTEYTFSAVVAQDSQGWSSMQNLWLGINSAGNRPVVPAAAFETPVTEFAYNFLNDADQTQLPDNADFTAGPFVETQWTFTPDATLVNPIFAFGTDGFEAEIFLDGRFRLFELRITSGSNDGGGGLPGCNAADAAAPFGVLNSSDINAFVSNFLGGCP